MGEQARQKQLHITDKKSKEYRNGEGEGNEHQRRWKDERARWSRILDQEYNDEDEQDHRDGAINDEERRNRTEAALPCPNQPN
jgi:hypothetical protein